MLKKIYDNIYICIFNVNFSIMFIVINIMSSLDKIFLFHS